MANKLLLIGCGKMGGALLDGFVKAGVDIEITVVEPSSAVKPHAGVSYYQQVKDVPQGKNFDIAIIAIKPQIIADALPEYQAVITSETLVVSIAAGKTVTFLESIFPGHAVIRTMPNLPVTVGKGAIVAVANDQVSEAQKSLTEQLLNSAGKLFWEKDESVMDAVTALSGSGPAYFFHFMECLIEAGEKLGLSEELAKNLAYQTALGSVLLATQSENSVTELREQVTSPKGTTEAALNIFMQDYRLKDLCYRAMQSAKDRSIELK